MRPQLTYYDLGEGVTAFSTTRHGGYSQGNYSELNVNLYCGDALEAIRQNRILLCQELDITTDRLIIPHQVHGKTIFRVTDNFLLMPDTTRNQELDGVDAVMTDVRDVCVGVSTADCIPILIYSPECHAVCAVHAGWRGTVQRITHEAVLAMVKAYRCCPERLMAVIGPGISLKNFEVGDEVYEQFRNADFPMDLISKRYTKWHIDLWACNRLQLQSAGLLPQHIQVSGVCTYDHADDFFSARRLGIDSGRIFTGIVIR